MSDLFDMEMEPEMEPEPGLLEVLASADAALAPATQATVAALAAREDAAMLAGPAVEVLPPDFNLPALVQFVPDGRLKARAAALAEAALAIDVTAPGGLQRADAALADLRGGIKAAEAHFEDPTSRAHKLHAWLTTTVREWLAVPRQAAATVGKRVVDEQLRQDEVANAARREAQALADQQERERAARAAAEAEKAQAPAAVVETLKAQARTATAPPVAAAATPPLKSTTTAKAWKARFTGTSPDADHHPLIKDLTDAQRLQLIELLKDVVEGRAPIAVLKEMNWAYLDDLAVGEQADLGRRLHGIEAFEMISPKAKASRRA